MRDVRWDLYTQSEPYFRIRIGHRLCAQISDRHYARLYLRVYRELHARLAARVRWQLSDLLQRPLRDQPPLEAQDA